MGEGGEEGEGDSSFFCSNFSVFYRHRGFQPLSLFSFLQTRFDFNLSIHIYSLLVWVFVCLSVGLCPKNVKTAEPTGPKFVVGPHMAQERFINDQYFKNLPPTKSDFH